MPADIPIAGSLSMDNLAASLTVHEQLMFQEVTALEADKTSARSLVTTIDQPKQIGALRICTSGSQSVGTKLFSTTVDILNAKSLVDVYRLLLSDVSRDHPGIMLDQADQTAIQTNSNSDFAGVDNPPARS